MSSPHNPCLIIGGGNSLRHFNFNLLKTEIGNIMPIFAPNDTFIELYKKGIKADNWVFWDMPYYQKKEVIINEFFENGTQIHTLNRYDLKKFNEWNVDCVEGLSRKPGNVGQMNSTMAMMVNIALHKGFTTIYLMGFDNDVRDFEHWYDENPATVERKKILHEGFKLFDKFMSIIALGLNEKERIVQIGGGFEYFDTVNIKTWNEWLMKKH